MNLKLAHYNLRYCRGIIVVGPYFTSNATVFYFPLLLKLFGFLPFGTSPSTIVFLLAKVLSHGMLRNNQ